MRAQLREAAKRLLASEYVVAFTGAGVSTPSGVPDFRSAGTGLFSFIDPLCVASISSFQNDPEAFYSWVRPFAGKVARARPSGAHRALAELEAHGLLHAVITQNVDRLHREAGSRRVLPLHGEIDTLVCRACRREVESARYWRSFLSDGLVPRCPCCGRVMKPSAVLFGEVLSHDVLREAQEEALRCDLMLVAGSSLEVMPAADIPALARRRGAELIIINEQPTHLDEEARFVFRSDVAQLLPGLVRVCERLLLTRPTVSLAS